MKSDVPYLDYIRDATAQVAEFTAGGRATFFDSALVQAATLRNLQTIAESTKRLSASRKATHPEVPWAQILAFRNVLVHEYDKLDLDRVWRVIEVYLPALRTVVEQMLTEGSMEPAPKERNHGDA